MILSPARNGGRSQVRLLLLTEIGSMAASLGLTAGTWAIAGPSVVGEFTIAYSIASLFSIYATLGFDRTLPLVEDARVERACRVSVTIAACIGVVSAAASVLLVTLASELFANGSHSTRLALALAFTAWMCCVGAGAVAMADQRLIRSGRVVLAGRIAAAPTVLVSGMQCACVFTLGASILAMVLGTALGWMLAVLIAAHVIRPSNWRPARLSDIRAAWGEIRSFSVARMMTSTIMHSRPYLVYLSVGLMSGNDSAERLVAVLRGFDVCVSGGGRVMARSWGSLVAVVNWRAGRGASDAAAILSRYAKSLLRWLLPMLIIAAVAMSVARESMDDGWGFVLALLPPLVLAGVTAIGTSWIDRLFDCEGRQALWLRVEVCCAATVVVAPALAVWALSIESAIWAFSLSVAAGYVLRAIAATSSPDFAVARVKVISTVIAVAILGAATVRLV